MDKEALEEEEFLGLMSEGCFTCEWCKRPQHDNTFLCSGFIVEVEKVVGEDIIKLGYKPEWCPGFIRRERR